MLCFPQKLRQNHVEYQKQGMTHDFVKVKSHNILKLKTVFKNSNSDQNKCIFNQGDSLWYSIEISPPDEN